MRVDVGIDPYKHFTDSPGRVHICRYVLPGGQRRPPLRVRTVSHWCIQIYDGVPRGRGKPRPYVTTKCGRWQNPGGVCLRGTFLFLRIQCGFYEALEEGVGAIGAAFELGVELCADEPRVLRILHDLDERAVG